MQQTCTGALSQQWSFNPVAGGDQIVSPALRSHCLNVGIDDLACRLDGQHGVNDRARMSITAEGEN